MKKVVFIAHQDVPPDVYPFVPLFKERILKMPASIFNKIHSLGKLGVYELNLKVERFIPSRFDPDYELKIGGLGTRKINIHQVEEPRAVGEQALYINNKSGKQISIKNVDVQQVGVRGRNSDNTMIKEKLGWCPTQPLRVGIEKTYKWIWSRYE